MSAGAESVTGRKVVPAGTRDPADFERWATACGPELLRFAYAVTGSAEAAADAVQDALVAIYPRWRRLFERGDPDAYVRRVIVNQRITWWRRLGRRELVGHEPYETAELIDRDGTDTVLALSLLRTLPVKQRAAVVLRYLEDLSFAEIGQVLDCTESTARSQTHRALEKLRRQLGDNHG